jgi:hypothetical protein
MEKLIAWLLLLSAVVSIYLTYLDPTRVFIG